MFIKQPTTWLVQQHIIRILNYIFVVNFILDDNVYQLTIGEVLLTWPNKSKTTTKLSAFVEIVFIYKYV